MVAGIVLVTVSGCGMREADVGMVPVYPGAKEYEYPTDGPSRLELPRYTTGDSLGTVEGWYRKRLEREDGFHEYTERGPDGETVMFRYGGGGSARIVALMRGMDDFAGKTVIEVRTIGN